MFLLILSLLFNESGATGLRHSRGTSGLQRAGALIKEPLNSHKQINDIILTGITDSFRRKQLPITGASNACWYCMGVGVY